MDSKILPLEPKILIDRYRAGVGLSSCSFDKDILLDGISSNNSYEYKNCTFKSITFKKQAGNIQFENCFFDELKFIGFTAASIKMSDCTCNTLDINSTTSLKSIEIYGSTLININVNDANVSALHIARTYFEELNVDQHSSFSLLLSKVQHQLGTKSSKVLLEASGRLEVQILNSTFSELSIQESSELLKLEVYESIIEEVPIDKCLIRGIKLSNSNINNLIVKASKLDNLSVVEGTYGLLRFSESEIDNYSISTIDSFSNPVSIKSLICDGLRLGASSLLSLNQVECLSLSLNNLKNHSGKVEILNSEINGELSFENSDLGDATFNNLNLRNCLKIKTLNSSIIKSKFFNVQWRSDYRVYEYNKEIAECKSSREKIAKYYYPLREFYRQLVSVSNKELNKIDSLFFQKQELRIYFEIIKFDNLKSWAGFQDYLILGSNKLFSDFGQNIWLPLKWWLPIHAALIGILIQTHDLGVQIVRPENHSWGFFLKGLGIFLNLLNPIHSTEINKVSIFGVTDFALRVTAGYFLFYFISATRKFHLFK